MAEMSPKAALRELQRAQSVLRKAREIVRLARSEPDPSPAAFKAGWESLRQAHTLLASIPVEAAEEAVLTKHLAVSRYATALLVRLRRLQRRETGPIEDDDPTWAEGEE